MAATFPKIVTYRVQAVGVAGAVGVLAGAIRVYCRRVAERRGAQAARIGLQVSPANTDDGRKLLHLTNHGNEPVRASALVAPFDIDTKRSWRRAWLRPYVSVSVRDPVRIGRTLWPGDTDIMTATLFDETPTLYIADSGGRHWVRASSGALCEVDRVRVPRHGRDDPWMDQPRLTRPQCWWVKFRSPAA